ncbi:MAG: radical SAM protein [Candidatus Omnitrophota bacterium]
MRTLLINLPWNKQHLKGVRAGSRWPFTQIPEKDGHIRYIPFPFFLSYATALLKKQGQQAKLIDAIAEEINEDELLGKIIPYKPTIIFAETSTPSFGNDVMLMERLDHVFPDCQLALSGSHASVFAKEILEKYRFIDYVLIGEYENIVLELVQKLQDHAALSSIQGLAYRQDNEIQINYFRETISDLDSLPWPEREDLPLYKYNDGFAGMPVPNVQMWTSRGCSFQCSYCLWPQTIYREHRYRMRTPRDVVDEMQYLIQRYQFKAVYFDDDVININREHVFALCEEIIKRKINIPLAAMARADLMDEALLQIMVNAGFYAIKYGVESADDGILKLCKKDMDLPKVKKVIQLTKAMGVKVHLTFCLGLPGETEESVNRTLQFIAEVKPDSFQVSLATPFPGTAYFAYAKQHGLLVSDDWADYDANHTCVVKTETLSKLDLERLRDVFSSGVNVQ